MCLLLEILSLLSDCNCNCNSKDCNNCAECLFCFCNCYNANISHSSSRQKRFWVGSFLCFYGMTVLILAAIAVSQISDQQIAITNIQDNWKIDPIVDIYIMSMLSNNIFQTEIDVNQIANGIFIDCPTDYAPLYTFQIPAIVSGCSCPNGYMGLGAGAEYVSSGPCDTSHIGGGCQQVQNAQPLLIPYWPLQNVTNPNDSATFPVQFCKKLALGQNFYSQTTALLNLSPERCRENNLKVCDNVKSDGFYCIDPKYPCPVRAIKIAYEPLDPSEINNENWELINSPTGLMNSTNLNFISIYQSRNSSKLPISDIQPGWGDGVCIGNTQFALDQSRKEDYPLNNPQSEFCKIDQRYQKFAENYEERIFRTNFLYDKVMDTRPKYPIKKTVKVGLYETSYFPFRPECREKEFKYIDEISDQINKLLTGEIIVLVLSCIYFVLIVIIVLNELTRCFYECCECEKIVKHMILAIRWIFNMLLGGFIIYTFAFSIRIKQRFQEMINKQCSDDQSNFVFTDLVRGLDESVIPLNTAILVMLVLVLTVDCFIFWHHQIHKFNKYRQKMNNHNNNNNYKTPYQAPYYQNEQNNQITQNNNYNQPYQQNYQQNNPQFQQQIEMNIPPQNQNQFEPYQYQPYQTGQQRQQY